MWRRARLPQWMGMCRDGRVQRWACAEMERREELLCGPGLPLQDIDVPGVPQCGKNFMRQLR